MHQCWQRCSSTQCCAMCTYAHARGPSCLAVSCHQVVRVPVCANPAAAPANSTLFVSVLLPQDDLARLLLNNRAVLLTGRHYDTRVGAVRVRVPGQRGQGSRGRRGMGVSLYTCLALVSLQPHAATGCQCDGWAPALSRRTGRWPDATVVARDTRVQCTTSERSTTRLARVG
jgi:hypothetical protein